MILGIALLFAFSAALFVFYLSDQMMEDRLFSHRIKLLNRSARPADHSSGTANILQADLVQKESFLKQALEGFKEELSRTQIVIFISCLAVISFVVVFYVRIPSANKIMAILALTILTSRIMRVVAIKRRLASIQRELPGAMDLIVICLETGLGLNAAFMRVAREMEGSPLGKELKRCVNEITAGLPLENALRNFAARTKVPDIAVVVAAIIQAQKLGTALAISFRVQADSIREKYRMRIREQIAKIPIKILFPLILFIFPALFVVILGPAVIGYKNAMSGVG